VARILNTSIDIDAQPQRVWEVLLDFPSWKEWNPFIPSITGTLEVGARLRISVTPPGIKPMEFKPYVFSIRPGEEIIWGGSFLWVLYRGDHAIFLEPRPNCGTHFRQRERFRGPMALFMNHMIDATELGYHQMNQALKRRVEGKD